jgi:DNA-binding transcriptional LysR family regulator
MNDRLQQLALFVRTVETGSFSRAAREFGLTQPSASRAIASLEDRLGVKLIARTTRQISATGAGRALLARAREALAAVEDAENAARGADRVSGVLRVALPSTYGARRIAPLLPAFLNRHPLLKIDLMMSDRYENLIAEGAELALRVGAQPDSSFIARKLERTRRLFIAAPSYLARRGAPKRLADLAGHDLIGGGPATTGDHIWTARRNGRTETVSVEPRVFARSTAGVVACASLGLGVAVASIWMCSEELASGALVEALTEYTLDPVTAYAVFPAGRRPSQKARVFADYLERALAQSHASSANDGAQFCTDGLLNPQSPRSQDAPHAPKPGMGVR